jgi:hypothetical protein
MRRFVSRLNIAMIRGNRFDRLEWAALAIRNVGLAFVAGSLIHVLSRRGWLRL